MPKSTLRAPAEDLSSAENSRCRLGALGDKVAEEGVRLAALGLEGGTRERDNLEAGSVAVAGAHLLVVVEHLEEELVRLGEVRARTDRTLRELRRRASTLTQS